jgi:hypothetical protein
MDFRVIPIKKRRPNQYDLEETFVIPVTIIKILENKSGGPVVPIIIERLDFFSGKLKKTLAITFNKSLNILNGLGKKLPLQTDGIVFKEDGKINIKVIGAYNTGLVEEFFSVQDYILNNDEKQIKDIYEANYLEIRSWIGNINSNSLDFD